METGLVYKDGMHPPIKVLAYREIKKENFNPMVHRLIDDGQLDGCCQIKISAFGQEVWLNVYSCQVQASEDN